MLDKGWCSTCHHDHLVIPTVLVRSDFFCIDVISLQHMSQCLSGQGLVRLGKFSNLLDMIDPINKLTDSCSRNIPVVIFVRIEINKSDRNMPVVAVGRICCVFDVDLYKLR